MKFVDVIIKIRMNQNTTQVYKLWQGVIIYKKNYFDLHITLY